MYYDIIDYIYDNYITVIFFVVLILLAIIGYYAEKANNKSKQKDQLNKNELEEKINSEQQNDIKNEAEYLSAPVDDSALDNSLKKEESELILEQKKEMPSSEAILNEEKGDVLSSEAVLKVENNYEQSDELINENVKTEDAVFDKEEINKFNEEFELILPKKEIIDSDLLSDIDDLELGKTQKIDLSQVPDLDNIDLPKIKQMNKEEDIWKF